ncbi:6747_t:CDS:1, partial [Acaulospora morrowiae]
DLLQNDHYLRIIVDTPTRWNSSYLAWQRLIKIRKIIDFMITKLSLDENYQIRKESIRLKQINLNDVEWEAITNLITILEPFAEATELLRGSKYATISFMYNAITVITNSLIVFNNFELRQITYGTEETVFDQILNEDRTNNEQNTDQTEFQQLNITQDCTNLEEKVKIALYNAMKHYWQILEKEGMLATLLDSRCKTLSFASEF